MSGDRAWSRDFGSKVYRMPHSHDHAHGHHHGPASPHPAQAGAMVDPAHDADRPGSEPRWRSAPGSWAVVLAGDEVSMAAQLQFRDVTLGYDRHPAVHHLERRGRARRAARGGRPQRRRQIDAVPRHRRHPQAAGGHRSPRRPRCRATSPICRRRADIDRSFPISVFDFVGTGLWRTHRPVRRHRQARARQDRAGARRRRPQRLREPRRSARCRAGRCSACCSRGCCCRMRA